MREQYAPSRAVWVAGSTHGGVEEEAVIEAHRRVDAANPRALLVLAPRHPNRFGEVASWLERRGTAYTRRSQSSEADVVFKASASDAARQGCNVLLLDTLGELLYFYAAADVAFVGGSLAPIGGHNLLEPAALGLPVLTGPNNSNSEDVARLLRIEAQTVRSLKHKALTRLRAALADGSLAI